MRDVILKQLVGSPSRSSRRSWRRRATRKCGYKISAARAAAIHECSVRASRYVEHTWGDVEIYQYRALHGRA